MPIRAKGDGCANARKVEARRAVRRGGDALTRPRILALGVIAIVITAILLAAGCQASGGQRLEWSTVEREWLLA